jgi:ABC-type glycerol-3-phosphate transport system substrate-binding protein
VPYGTNFASGGDTFVMPVGTKHPQEAAELMLYMMQPDPVLAWCVGEANIPPTRAAIFDPRFLKGAPTDASAIATARLGITKPQWINRSSTSSVEAYAISTYENAEQQVLFGRATATAALNAAQQLVLQRQKQSESGNSGWG